MPGSLVALYGPSLCSVFLRVTERISRIYEKAQSYIRPMRSSR